MERLEAVVRDIRLAGRLLTRRPLFATVAVVTIAVGLGTMTVAFSAVNAFFLANAPRDREGMGLIVVGGGGPENDGASFREFEVFARDVPALEIGAQTIVTLSRQRDGVADTTWGLAVSDNYFEVLGVRAARGRTFTATDELAAVVSDRFWRDHLFEASLAGLAVNLNGLDVPVIGVMPTDFRSGLYDNEVWVRMTDWDALRLPARSRRPDAFGLTMVARLRHGATDDLAQLQVQTVAGELARVWPSTNARRIARFVSREEGLPEVRALAIVATFAMAMIGIVLLIALFNLTGLLLSRAVEREREMSLRGALGASRARLIQQLICESLVITALGGALALLVAQWSNRLLATFAPEAPVPQRMDVTPDWTVAAFTGVLIVVSGFAAGLLPARRATSLGIAATMAPPTVTGGARTTRMRAMVVSTQIAGATLLLTVAALLARDAVLSAAVDLGFESERAVVLELDPGSYGYTESATQRFVTDAVTAFRALPGVVSAAAMDRVPFYVGFPTRVEVSVDGRSCALEDCPTVGGYHVGRDYFRTMNIPLTSGRELDDSPADANAVVISETMAQRFWPSVNAVGQYLALGPDGDRVQVVGVAADIKHRSVTEQPEPYVYRPFDQAAFAQPVSIVLRTAADPAPLLQAVSDRVRAMDASLPIARLRTMGQRIAARQQSGTLLVARFFGVCSGLALFLSIVGLVGVVTYSVGQRSRELGIRAALGAAPGDLRRLVAAGALRMAGSGIVIGLFGALLVSWLIAGTLSGVDLDSPMVFVAVGVVQFATALIAVAIPARVAASADPLVTLRAE